MKTAEEMAKEVVIGWTEMDTPRHLISDRMRKEIAQALTAFAEERVKAEKSYMQLYWHGRIKNARADALEEGIKAIQGIVNFGNHMILNEAVELLRALKRKP